MLTLRIDCIPNPPPSAPTSFTWDLACAYAWERLCNVDDDGIDMEVVVTECYERACKLKDAVCEKEVFRMCHVMVKER